MFRVPPNHFVFGHEWRLVSFNGDAIPLRTLPRSGNDSPYRVRYGAVLYEPFPSPLNGFRIKTAAVAATVATLRQKGVNCSANWVHTEGDSVMILSYSYLLQPRQTNQTYQHAIGIAGDDLSC